MHRVEHVGIRDFQPETTDSAQNRSQLLDRSRTTEFFSHSLGQYRIFTDLFLLYNVANNNNTSSSRIQRDPDTVVSYTYNRREQSILLRSVRLGSSIRHVDSRESLIRTTPLIRELSNVLQKLAQQRGGKFVEIGENYFLLDVATTRIIQRPPPWETSKIKEKEHRFERLRHPSILYGQQSRIRISILRLARARPPIAPSRLIFTFIRARDTISLSSTRHIKRKGRRKTAPSKSRKDERSIEMDAKTFLRRPASRLVVVQCNRTHNANISLAVSVKLDVGAITRD